MAEYIERERVYDIFSAKQQELLKYHRYYQLNDAAKEEFDLYDSYMDEVESIPAADVVEVVRCKDCKHYYHGTCTNDFALNLMRENDYCSYGERRSENES